MKHLQVLLLNLFKNHPDFYRSFIETESDGDTKNLDKLFTRFFESKGITPELKNLQKKMKSRFTSEFKVYPKTNKPEDDLNNEPPNKNYYFSTILSNKVDHCRIYKCNTGQLKLQE